MTWSQQKGTREEVYVDVKKKKGEMFFFQLFFSCRTRGSFIEIAILLCACLCIHLHVRGKERGRRDMRTDKVPKDAHGAEGDGQDAVQLRIELREACEEVLRRRVGLGRLFAEGGGWSGGGARSNAGKHRAARSSRGGGSREDGQHCDERNGSLTISGATRRVYCLMIEVVARFDGTCEGSVVIHSGGRSNRWYRIDYPLRAQGSKFMRPTSYIKVTCGSLLAAGFAEFR